MTKKKIEAVQSGLIFVSLVFHLFGYFFWQQVTIINLYYVSVYFMMMNLGLCLVLCNSSRFLHYISTAIFSLGGGFLYMEFSGDPSNWTNVNIITFIFIGANSLLISRYIETKKIKNGTANN